jgi:ABC-type transport system substrate-binding protein
MCGLNFSLLVRADSTDRVAAANFIRDDLAKVGIRVNLHPMEFNARVQSTDYEAQYGNLAFGPPRSVASRDTLAVNGLISSLAAQSAGACHTGGSSRRLACRPRVRDDRHAKTVGGVRRDSADRQ